MSLYSCLFSLTSFSILFGIVNAQTNGISLRDKMEEMEHIWVDNAGINSDGFVNAVTPCSNYVGFASDATDRGEQSSAQWVRVAFHDFVTGNLSTGLGGLDASVGFEVARPGNEGLFINDTLQFMLPTVTAYLSMSDNIALGVIASVAECGGTSTGILPKVGRIDADGAASGLVPVPATSLENTLAQFEAAGFDQSDTIALTACGHSLGRVHYSNNPTIVNESYVTSTNLDGGEEFDSTPAVFDSTVVNEYLNGTGQRGGPLVTAPLVADRSDLRLYVSDDNATVESISEESAFQTKCTNLFQRMIDTVPAAVTLSDPITPMTWKAVDLMLDISTAGVVSISGLIRNLYTTTAPPDTVSYTTTSSGTNSTAQTSSTTSGNGTSIFGSTIYWPFNNTLNSPGTTSLNFETITYPVDDTLFILPSQSTVNSSTNEIVLRAAALTSSASGTTMTGVFYVPTSQTGTITKKITNTTLEMSSYGTAGNYTLFEGSATVSQSTSIVAKVLLGGVGSQTVKTKIFVGGV
ncbi:heme peroxidase [Mollisia scopiformis]|uniref:Peroxidase n=1 Tax=Mollisia scopiformis TaxID=149040 RepID=A0A132B876_MOLSC|nr:heme peroxidase [Mollisia scopiformis]KUJ07877.1 heme peroxidase [Mollisia scopiformis]